MFVLLGNEEPRKNNIKHENASKIRVRVDNYCMQLSALTEIVLHHRSLKFDPYITSIASKPKAFCGFPWVETSTAGRVYDLCVYYMTGAPEGSPKVFFFNGFKVMTI